MKFGFTWPIFELLRINSDADSSCDCDEVKALQESLDVDESFKTTTQKSYIRKASARSGSCNLVGTNRTVPGMK